MHWERRYLFKTQYLMVSACGIEHRLMSAMTPPATTEQLFGCFEKRLVGNRQDQSPAR